MGFFWFFTTIYIGIYASILIHELGHFIAAQRIGLQQVGLSVGFTRPILAWTYKGGDFKLSALPLGGQTTFYEDLDEIPTPKAVLLLIGGPAANVLTALLAFAFLWLRYPPGQYAPGFEFGLTTYGLMSALFGILCLVPFPGTDGGLLLTVLRRHWQRTATVNISAS